MIPDLFFLPGRRGTAMMWMALASSMYVELTSSTHGQFRWRKWQHPSTPMTASCWRHLRAPTSGTARSVLAELGSGHTSCHGYMIAPPSRAAMVTSVSLQTI